MSTLLLVEDDSRIANFIERGLAAEGHRVEVARNGADGLAMARANAYPLIVLDRMLPDMDGADVCRTVREEGRPCRILMLTARDSVNDRIAGLKAGADDYLVKPFSFDEFILRIEALLRRGELVRPTAELVVADLRLDPATRTVSRAGRPILPTPKEYALLRYLMENPDTVLSRPQILNQVWGYSFDPGTKVVDVYVRYLRRKVDLAGEAPLIHTVRGAGYLIGLRDAG